MFAVSLNCALKETNMDNRFWGVIYNKSTYAASSVNLFIFFNYAKILKTMPVGFQFRKRQKQ